MKKRILLGMCVILTAASVYAMGGSEEAAAVAKADKQLTIHMVFNGMVFDGNWDIYRLAAAKTGVMLKGTASKNGCFRFTSGYYQLYAKRLGNTRFERRGCYRLN